MELDQDRIRQRAYDIWVREGCPADKDAEHWEQAQREVSAEAAEANSGQRPTETPVGATEAKPGRTPR